MAATTALPVLVETDSIARRATRIVVRLLPVGIAAVLVIDWVLGDTAEYFHALRLVEAWGQVITSGGIEPDHEFIVGQAAMGGALSLAVGTALLVAEPALVLGLVVFPVTWVARHWAGRTRS